MGMGMIQSFNGFFVQHNGDFYRRWENDDLTWEQNIAPDDMDYVWEWLDSERKEEMEKMFQATLTKRR